MKKIKKIFISYGDSKYFIHRKNAFQANHLVFDHMKFTIEMIFQKNLVKNTNIFSIKKREEDILYGKFYDS